MNRTLNNGSNETQERFSKEANGLIAFHILARLKTFNEAKISLVKTSQST